MKKKVLFVCIHNSARSQMAETFCNAFGGEDFIAESAGLEAGTLNQNVVKVMAEVGFDISKNQCNDVFDFYKEGKTYSYVITVCDESSSQRCPIFPGLVEEGRLHWNFADPSGFTGSADEALEQTRKVRDQIKQRVLDFITGK